MTSRRRRCYWSWRFGGRDTEGPGQGEDRRHRGRRPGRRARPPGDRSRPPRARGPASPGTGARPEDGREPPVAAVRAAHAAGDGHRHLEAWGRHLHRGRAAAPRESAARVPGRAARLHPRPDVRGAADAGGRLGRPRRRARDRRAHGRDGRRAHRHVRDPRRSPGLPPPRPRLPPRGGRRLRQPDRGGDHRDAHRDHLGDRADQHVGLQPPRVGRDPPPHLRRDPRPQRRARPARDERAPRARALGAGRARVGRAPQALPRPRSAEAQGFRGT